MKEIELRVFEEDGMIDIESISFSEFGVKFIQWQESRENVNNYDHSGFDMEIEYDISMIYCLINALMQHYEEKPIPNYSNIRNELSDKQLKLLHLVYSFFTSDTLFYWEDGLIGVFDSVEVGKPIAEKIRNKLKLVGYRPKKVDVVFLSNLIDYFNHYGIKEIINYCL